MLNIIQGMVCELKEAMGRVREVLERIAAMLAQEYGAGATGPAHNPAAAPAVFDRTLAAGQMLELDLQRALAGKPANRGHVANIGEDELSVTLIMASGQSSSPYPLMPSQVLDLASLQVARLIVSAPAGGRVAVMAQ